MADIHIVDGPHGALEVNLVGPVDGRPIVAHHGTPGAAHPSYAPMDEIASARGWRQIFYSRPGYGNSARHAGRTVADCAADVEAIVDALGIDRFHTVGGSGGGPHALATAALLGDRVISAASIAGLAPFEADGLDWLAGQGQDNVDEITAALAGEEDLRTHAEPFRAEILGATGEDIHESIASLLCDVDRATLTGDFAQGTVDVMGVALARGIDGWVDDDLAFIKPWGFDLASITVPVTIWQGALDQFVPAAHGDWLMANVPGARAMRLSDHGHLSIAVGLFDQILDDLLVS